MLKIILMGNITLFTGENKPLLYKYSAIQTLELINVFVPRLELCGVYYFIHFVSYLRKPFFYLSHRRWQGITKITACLQWSLCGLNPLEQTSPRHVNERPNNVMNLGYVLLCNVLILLSCIQKWNPCTSNPAKQVQHQTDNVVVIYAVFHGH